RSRVLWLLLACVVLAAAASLLPAAPTYDPWAWLMWGREITELDLDTRTGPSWKPLPVLFTTPFALAGDDWAPELWLVVAQAGGLLALAFAYRLASRLAGRAAGAIAAAGLLLADEFVRHFARGNSEGILVAVCLWAVESHLDGRRTRAFLLGVAGGLLRPELWPFLLAYGLWLMWREPRRRALVVACGALTLALWFLPEWWGSGDPLRAAARARDPNPDSAAFAEHPFLETFRRAELVLMFPVLLGAALGLGAAALRRDAVRLALGGIAAVLMVAVAAMTQAGFAGNLRYVALPAALVCVLAGAGWTDLVRALSARLGRLAAAAAAVALVVAALPYVRDDRDALRADLEVVRSEADLYEELPPVIAQAGGRTAILRCPPVYSSAFEQMAVAWALHVHARAVQILPAPPGTAVAGRRSVLGRDPRFRPVVENRRWIVTRRCASPAP
ncbi:MAG TPA: hypothetical protein VN213_15115, partial [Solirubrobacteraceae bacterium]|nr:hypothetical protein [Solirubrobacteraceae bacterium]